ncbi:hypothetical protein C8F01DRAFT_1000095, partial [Mycena amicta]
CDAKGLDGQVKALDIERASFSHAQKMRAALTYGFGRVAGHGNRRWEHDQETGKSLGNPSISETVSWYMNSLQRAKVRGGETPTSARAMTPEVMEKLYHYNHLEESARIRNIERRSRTASNNSINDWGGGGVRRMLQAVYTLAFSCLLRFDEALNISIHHIEIISDDCFVLTLPFRKTDQHGEIKPFYLYRLPDEQAHLCPVRALSEWLDFSKIDSGLLFPSINNRDQIDPSKSMRAEKFLEYFRHNLIDVGVDPYPYGTHSFRRGGCQYLATYCRWPLRRICDWGGWSMELTNLTIVKYLISWNDNPTERREDFMNPRQPVTRRCPSCGRTCNCA